MLLPTKFVYFVLNFTIDKPSSKLSQTYVELVMQKQFLSENQGNVNVMILTLYQLHIERKTVIFGESEIFMSSFTSSVNVI